jgi:hypothetical protein
VGGYHGNDRPVQKYLHSGVDNNLHTKPMKKIINGRIYHF